MSLFAFKFLFLLRTISASPLPYHQNPKRSTTSQNVGSGFAIAICIILLAAIFYYLGMRHSRTKSWLSARKTHTQPTLSHDSRVYPEARKHKRQISCPLAVSSSAPIKPYDERVLEAPTPSLLVYYEMHAEQIHELGLPSPRKPAFSASGLERERMPWWLEYVASSKQRGDGEEKEGGNNR
ncbi:hypothetical protein E8E12_004743 [Didymella heteroderae]|uniref:Uncharacterized protein n=1 Tax=Didymella heteroderae TaxID=1769908 RepID=A0A9P4WID5_9PLEO|nr:hypothetical protein E8E12_004743 [Didymella heteroderae]